MSAALGLKVRTVVSLHLWDLFRTRALGEPGSEGVRHTGRHTASRSARHRGHADAHGRQVRIPACAWDGKVKHAIRPAWPARHPRRQAPSVVAPATCRESRRGHRPWLRRLAGTRAGAARGPRGYPGEHLR